VLGNNAIREGCCDGVLRSWMPRSGGAVLASTVVSLPVLLTLRQRFEARDGLRWGINIQELPATAQTLGVLTTVERAWPTLSLLITPSPAAEVCWREQLQAEEADAAGSEAPEWLVLPDRDDAALVRGYQQRMPPPRWPATWRWRLLGFGRDDESFARFRAMIRRLRDLLPEAGGLWVGPVGSAEEGLIRQETVHVTQALETCSLFLLTTGGSAKPGETFGLVAAEALALGCPMLVAGAPIVGVKHWWPVELRPELRCDDSEALLVRILRVLRGGEAERERRRRLAAPCLEQLQRDWQTGIAALADRLIPFRSGC
jgi:hypothetical protein